MTTDLTKGAIDKLCRRLGYVFEDPELLRLALTHRSVSGAKNNERLEFLGDSIVNFVIANALFQQHAKAKEGQLSRLRSELVKGQTLAGLARELDLGDYLLMGAGELKSGGFRRDSVLADVMEAVIGAIYLDAGMEACQQRICDWFQERLATVNPNAMKDAKTRLQEAMQAYKYALPQYTVDSAEGEPHAQTFTVQCVVPGISYVAEGVGGSIRKAEQAAAQRYLDWTDQQGLKHLKSAASVVTQ